MTIKDNEYPHIKQAIKDASVIKIGNGNNSKYKFMKYPFGEMGTHLSHELTNEIVYGFSSLIKQTKCNFDIIVSPEPGGHTWGILLGHIFQKDVVILRNKIVYDKNSSKLIINAYSKKYIQYPKIDSSLNVIIVDDVISSGITIMDIVENIEANIIGIFAIYSKSKSTYNMLKNKKIPIDVIVTG